jgi:uncharacterized membrane protein
MAASLAPKMPPTLRVAVKTAAALLWLSGCIWLVLHFFFAEQGEFGVGPNRWEATTLRVHGVVAILAVFLFGWMVSRHVVDAWRQPKNKMSGVAFVCIVGALCLSGYALYYLASESAHASFAVVHEVIGALAIGIAFIHWRVAKR